MSQVSSIFITVTTTVSGTPAPTLNATELHKLELSKETGQIVALTSLALFGFLALLLLVCWGILRLRRPRPPPVIENPDAVQQGRDAFLPIIGGRNRKSTISSLGTAVRGGGNGDSRQSLVGYQPPQSRRPSMWADESPYTPPIPSPPLFTAHTRPSSAASVERMSARHQRARSTSSSGSTASIHSVNHGFATRYYGNGSMDFIPLESPPPPTVSPRFGHVDHSLRVEVGRSSFEEQRVNPLVWSEELNALGIARYPRESSGLHDGMMYA
jgi:hypothetical protein